MAVYTTGDWHAKRGREQEFVDAWQEFANWSGAEYDVGGWAKLLRDKEDPTHFRSVAEWDDEQVIERWRTGEGFKQRMANMRELLDDTKIYVMDPVAELKA
jgi:quinol monooxygenase YgiN